MDDIFGFVFWINAIQVGTKQFSLESMANT